MSTSSNPATIFVILDPSAERQPALDRAMRIARAAHCGIHLFICVYEPEERGGGHDSRKEHKYDVIRAAEERIDAWRSSCRDADVHCDIEVVWGSRWADSALRSITRSSYALVVKSSYDQSRRKRRFSEVSDFSLMRYSNVPVLFTHGGEHWSSDRLLACVDVASEDADHDRLNDLIIYRARSLANLLDLRLCVAACFRDRIKYRPEVVANRFDVQPELIYLREGPIFDAMQSLCQQLAPALLMLGTLAHTATSGKLVGSTIAEMLDLVDTDIVTVI